MHREDQLHIIFTQFDQSAKQFCEDTNGIFCEISSVYKGAEKPQNLKYRFAQIYYHSFIVKFVYTAHAVLNTVNSILGCAVYLDKHKDSVAIPLPLVADYCNRDVAAPMYIPFITNDRGITQAFDCIGSVLRDLLPELADISSDSEYKTKILTAFHDEMKYIFEIDDEDQVQGNMSELFFDFFTLRFCSDAFVNYLKGNTAKAIKQLNKVKKRTGYENRMLDLWVSEEQSENPDLSAIITNAETYNENGVPKANFREFGALFLSWILLTPLTSAVYIGLFWLLVYFEGRESVYLMGPIYNFPFCILFGFVTAIAVSYFTRFAFYKWLHKKHYEKYCEMDYIQNGGGADKLMKGFLVFLVVLGVAGCVLLAKWNLNFLPDGFIDNSKFFSLHGEYHAYNEIEKVYYKPDRVNGFNETIDFPSYVLVLKDGTEIDLYEHGEIADYENELLEYLGDQGIKIEGRNAYIFLEG